MAEKPTYEVLERRLEGLEKRILECEEKEHTLRRRYRRLHAAIESLPFDFFAIDADGCYTMQNTVCMEHWGDLVGKRPQDISTESDTLALWLDNNRRAFSGETVQGDVEFTVADEQRHFHNIVSPILKNGEIEGIVGINIDITERKRGEEALRDSEQKFRGLAEQSPNMIFINKGGRVVYANRRCEEIMGYKREEFCSPDFDFRTLIVPESAAVIEIAFAKHMKGEEVAPYEYGLITKDGRRIEAINSPKLIPFEGEKAILGIVTDITKVKRIEEILREKEAKYREVVERANDGIAIIQDGLLKYVNPRLAEMTGHTVEEGINPPFTDYVHPDDVSEAVDDLKRLMAGQPMPAITERALRHKNGSRIETEVSGGIITYQNEPANLIIIRDITERKRAEEKLRQTTEELEAQTHRLEEMNTALKVLIEQREKDKVELEETILSNVKQLVLVHLKMLQKSGLSAKQLAYLSILESNLNDIISPFLRSLSSKYTRLTPREIQVADLIKIGKTTKEIAEVLNLSTRAIEFHRENIRAKLGLKNKPANLRSHLMSLS